jgi:hypothetical protein
VTPDDPSHGIPAHVEKKHIPGGLPFGNGHRDHVGGNPRPASKVFLTREQVRAVGRLRWAVALVLLRSPPAPGSEAMVPGALAHPVKGRRRLCSGHPETQYERVHGTDQGHRGIATGERAQHFADRACGSRYAFPNAAVVERNACEQKPGVAQPVEVGSIELTSLLALAAIRSEARGYRSDVFVDGIDIHRDLSPFWHPIGSGARSSVCAWRSASTRPARGPAANRADRSRTAGLGNA